MPDHSSSALPWRHAGFPGQAEPSHSLHPFNSRQTHTQPRMGKAGS
ncbi:MAG: hypothetical protein JEZ06_10325 [Anaerolineaceae bacterium]|nr:hypothetical protein [Anaerolineaceae bacterium]